MATVHDVAAYILMKAAPMSAMKLQKLCYFSYGYHLAWEERPLFGERFEAWANGPVAPVLYSRHRGRFELRRGDIEGDPTALDDAERESIDVVLENMKVFSANELSDMTHRTGPWVQARERASVADLDRSTEVLRDEEIADFFGALAEQSGADD